MVDKLSRVHPDFALPHPKSLSQRARDFERTPLLPFWEKGLGDEGETYKGGMHSTKSSSKSEVFSKAKLHATSQYWLVKLGPRGCQEGKNLV